MVCIRQDMEEETEGFVNNSGYVIHRKGGRSLIDKPPQFSPDEKLLFVISGRGVQIYDVATTEFVRSLKDKSSAFRLVGLGFPPEDERALMTCSEDGSIVTWKWHAGVESSKTTLSLPSNARILSFSLLTSHCAIIGWRLQDTAFVGLANLTTGNFQRVSLPDLEVKPSWNLAVQADTGFVAVAAGTSDVYIFNKNRPNKFFKHIISGHVVQCLSWHPSQPLLAVGDALGRVFLCRGSLLQSYIAKETLHWHTLPVSTVSFSLRGGVMFSGGAERVLVAWSGGGGKRFVPRMPAEIMHVSSSTTCCAVSTADNGIQIVDNGTLTISGVIREAGGLGGVVGGRRVGPALQYVRPASALLLPAGPGHLHMYSTNTDRLLYTLDVTNTNIVPPERDNLHPEQIEVNEMSVGCGGSWLCTWEGSGEQERLRWWCWAGPAWQLSSVAPRPHRPAPPAALHLAQEHPTTLTVDQHGQAAFWTLNDNTEGRSAWCCMQRISLECGAGAAGGAALSCDGSAAAAWAGARLTLWDPCTGRQKACLAHPALRPQGRLVSFGRQHHMHYLACTTDNALGVWNSMSLRLLWLVRLDASCLVGDPFSDRLAVITRSNDIHIFRMSSSQPEVSLRGALPASHGAITSAAFAPVTTSSSAHFKLFLLREQQEIFLMEHESQLPLKSESVERVGAFSAPPPASAYSARLAAQLSSQQPGTGAPHSSRHKANLITQLLLSSASHASPSMSSLCSAVLMDLAGSSAASYSTSSGDPEPAQEDLKVKQQQERSAKPCREVSELQLREEKMDWALGLLK